MKRRAGVAGTLLALLIAFVVLAVAFGGCGISAYNHVIKLDENVTGKWAQVENQLQRRYDLIPNLVETAKGYASHEKEIFENIAAARTKYFNADSRNEKVEASNGLERALSRLLVLRETYPELKAQESFTRLMDSLEGTENRIATERMRFNESVQALNAYRRQFFGRLVSGWAGIGEAKYFETPKEAETAPKVDFDG